MHTDLFNAMLERRNARKHPLLSALAYAFCPQAAFLWRAGLTPQPVQDPVWKALQDYANGGTLAGYLQLYGLEAFSEAAEQHIADIQEFRGENPVHGPELSPIFGETHPTAEEKRQFTQAVEKHFGSWDALYGYIRAWSFLLGDWRLRSGIPNVHPYELRKTPIAIHLPDLGEPVYWQVWAWWVKVEHSTTVHVGLLTPNGERDPFRPYLVRTSSPDGDDPWPGGLPRIHQLNYQTGEVDQPETLIPDGQAGILLGKLASLAEEGPYVPANLLRRPSACDYCGFQKFCINDERPTEIAWRGLEDVPAWQPNER